MNQYFKTFSLVTAVLGIACSQSGAALIVAPGDLLMGFFQVNGAGTGVQANTYVYNLGSAAGFREQSTVPLSIDNIGADLSTAFGPGWASDPNVRWGIVGVVGATDSLTNGDPARTTYFSTNFGGSPGSSNPLSLSSNQRGTLSTQLKTFSVAMNGIGENGAVDGGAIYPSSSPSSFSSFLPPGQTTNFGLSASPLTAFGSGTAGLDVYRVLHSAASADLTAGLSPGDASVGAGQYVGTFTLSADGQLSLVPEPTAGVLAGLGMMMALRRRRRA